MKITFQSLRDRDTDKLHEPDFYPWDGRQPIVYQSDDKPVHWVGGECVHGALEKVNLHGRFHVVLAFSEADLKNWIESYIEEKPHSALSLLADMMQLAVKELK